MQEMPINILLAALTLLCSNFGDAAGPCLLAMHPIMVVSLTELLSGDLHAEIKRYNKHERA